MLKNISIFDISKKERYLYKLWFMCSMVHIKITNMLKFYALCLLAQGPKHGYDLIKELQQKLERRISASNVYPFLENLRKNRLIKFDKIGKRDKKIFYLTNDGRNFTKQMFSKFGDLINVAIEPKITVCPCGCKIYAGTYTEKIRGKLMKFCCSHCAKMYRSKM